MKLQITITDQEEKLLAQKASQLGYDVTKYAKFLLSLEAVKAFQIPTYTSTPDMERSIEKARAEDKAGLTKKWDSNKYGD